MICQEPERYGFLTLEQADALFMEQDEPLTYQEVITSPESEKWLEVMKSKQDE